MTLLFATCDHQPLLTDDDAVLAAALRPLGIDVTPVPWTEIDPFAAIDAPPILLRSTWDYHRLPTMFGVWLQGLQDSGRTVWNSPETVLANIDKLYLRQLEERGIAIPKTRWLERPDAASIRTAMLAEGWQKAVLKPRIAATAYGTYLMATDTSPSEDELAPARASGALLQEYIAEVAAHGETSMVYCDGVFSHAVIKHARPGDFRVQKDFGGSVEAITPAAELIAFGDRVMATIPERPLYARVDVIESARGPLLMELELIEPELYFLVVPESAGRFAVAIQQRLT